MAKTILTQGWKVEDQFDTVERLMTNLTQRPKVEDQTVFKPYFLKQKVGSILNPNHKVSLSILFKTFWTTKKKIYIYIYI